MTFQFEVEAAHRVGGRIFVLDGLLKDGVIRNGTDATIVELSRPIHIKNVAIGGLPTGEKNRLSLHIDEPNFPLSEIEKGMIVQG